MSFKVERKYNFNSIGDLFDYRKYLYCEIKKYIKYQWLSPIYSTYILYCMHMLKIVNILIRKKGY